MRGGGGSPHVTANENDPSNSSTATATTNNLAAGRKTTTKTRTSLLSRKPWCLLWGRSRHQGFLKNHHPTTNFSTLHT